MAVRNGALVPNGLHVFLFLAGPGLAGGTQKIIHQGPYPLPAALPVSQYLLRELLFAWHLREI